MILPEKVYIKHPSPKLHTASDSGNNVYSAYKYPLTDKYTEYIRTELVYQVVKEFAKTWSREVLKPNPIRCFDDVLTEFINDRIK